MWIDGTFVQDSTVCPLLCHATRCQVVYVGRYFESHSVPWRFWHIQIMIHVYAEEK